MRNALRVWKGKNKSDGESSWNCFAYFTWASHASSSFSSLCLEELAFWGIFRWDNLSKWFAAWLTDLERVYRCIDWKKGLAYADLCFQGVLVVRGTLIWCLSWYSILVLVERLVHVWGPNWATEGRVSQMSLRWHVRATSKASSLQCQRCIFVILANQILTVPMVQYGGQIRIPTSIRGRNLIISSWASWGVWSWLTLVLHLRREWKGLGAFLKRESGDFLTRIRLQCLQWEDCCFHPKFWVRFPLTKVWLRNMAGSIPGNPRATATPTRQAAVEVFWRWDSLIDGVHAGAFLQGLNSSPERRISRISNASSTQTSRSGRSSLEKIEMGGFLYGARWAKEIILLKSPDCTVRSDQRCHVWSHWCPCG